LLIIDLNKKKGENGGGVNSICEFICLLISCIYMVVLKDNCVKNMHDLYQVTTEFVVPIMISLIEDCY
jgi:hypothetical protein